MSLNLPLRHVRINLVFLGIFLLLPFKAVFADTHTVSPLIVDFKAEARTIEHRTITVTNGDSGGRVDIFPLVNNVTVGESGGVEEFISPTMTDRSTNPSSWIEIPRRALELKPGETGTVDFTLRIAPKVMPGVYHVLISFAAGHNQVEAERKVAAGVAPGVMVNITIEDRSVELLSLTRFLVDRFIVSNDNEAISYVVENTGDDQLIPSGSVIIYNHRGEEVGSVPVNAEAATVHPGETRTFTTALPIDGLVGKYKAYLALNYGNTQRAQLQDTTFFYALPWKKLLVLFGGILLVALALALLAHKRFAGDEEDFIDDDGEYLPLHVRETVSQPVHHDIDMKPRI